jgi:hypothetical protein
LKSVFGLDSFVFFSHNVSPNDIELVQNLGNASFGHFGIEGVLNFLNFLDSISWNPFVGITIFSSGSSSSSFVWLNVKCFANIGDTLIRKVLSSSHNL